MQLSGKITENKKEITKYLHCSRALWKTVIERIKKQELDPRDNFADEQIWTFLIACGYAIAGENGLKQLCALLTGQSGLSTEKIWLETLPPNPRIKEGATHLDLAIGNIKIRKGTKGGIELIPIENSWIAFCEMKWYSDISLKVSYDQHRNQLARVIENAIFFKSDNSYAENIYVTLVTPEIFKKPTNKSRLYCYKFDEYKNSKETLEDDLLNCNLEFREKDAKNRIKQGLPTLRLKWTTFDSLFGYIPESDISDEIIEFARKYNKAKC